MLHSLMGFTNQVNRTGRFVYFPDIQKKDIQTSLLNAPSHRAPKYLGIMWVGEPAYIAPTRESVLMIELCNTLVIWWPRQDSNLGPRDYEVYK